MQISTIKNLYKKKTGKSFTDEYMLFYKTRMPNDNDTVEKCRTTANKCLYLLSVESNKIIAAYNKNYLFINYKQNITNNIYI